MWRYRICCMTWYLTTEPFNGKKIFVYMISEINETTIDNINDVRIRYMNYETLITVIRNLGLKFITMILLNFQIFTIFFHLDLKRPFIKFSINTLLLSKYSPWVLYYCSKLFSSSLSASNTSLFAGRSRIHVPNAFGAFAFTIILTLNKNHHYPPEWLLRYPLATCSYSSPSVTKQCLQP